MSLDDLTYQLEHLAHRRYNIIACFMCIHQFDLLRDGVRFCIYVSYKSGDMGNQVFAL